MRCRLRTYEQAPPGGFPYHQRKGIDRKFEQQPMIEAQARMVSDFRKANGLERSSIKESLEDVDRYTCLRLGCMNTYCVEVDAQNVPVVSLAPNHPIIAGRCRGCGAPIT